jgi:hypothetical protein
LLAKARAEMNPGSQGDLWQFAVLNWAAKAKEGMQEKLKVQRAKNYTKPAVEVRGIQVQLQIRKPALIVVLRVGSFTWYSNSEPCRSISSSLTEGDYYVFVTEGSFQVEFKLNTCQC